MELLKNIILTITTVAYVYIIVLVCVIMSEFAISTFMNIKQAIFYKHQIQDIKRKLKAKGIDIDEDY